MALWPVVFLVAVVTVTADPEALAVFPESINERLGENRIVSGWEAREGQFPHQLSIRMVNQAGGVNACGGTIIHAEWGLTAAHCTATRPTIVVRAGVVNLTRPAIFFETTEFYNHPAYDASRPGVVQPNDIAVIKFPRALPFSERVQPIRLQASVDMNRNYDGNQLIASGWGRTWTNGASPENMNWVYLRGTSNTFCLQAYNGSPTIQPSTICARYYNVTSQSTCQGDSGGPLTVIDDDGKVSQIGVTSFVSSQGCHVDIPAGFIRSGHYHDWYREVTGINFDWKTEDSSSEESIETSEESEEETSTTPESTTEQASTAGPTEVPESEENGVDGDDSGENEDGPEELNEAEVSQKFFSHYFGSLWRI